jgi:hypothetical protein
VDEIDDVLRGGAGEEDFGDAGLLEGGNIGFGDDPAEDYGDVVHAFVAEQRHELWAEGVVGAGENREADDVDVFLDGGGGDHLRGLAEAGVDDFHAGVAEGAGDNLGAAVVAVEAGLGDQYANFLFRHSGVLFSVRSVNSVSYLRELCVKDSVSDDIPLDPVLQNSDIKIYQQP